MTSIARMLELADKKAKGSIKTEKTAKKNTPRKGGDGRIGSVPPLASEELVRLIFPCPPALATRIASYWHDNGLASKSEAIRVLLEKGLSK